VRTNEGGYWQNNVRNFVEDENGNIWISTSLGFGRWDLENNTMKMFLPKAGAVDQLDQPSVRGLYYDGHYLVLGTSSGGIWLFNPATEKYRRPDYGPGDEGKKLKDKLENEFIKQIVPLPGGEYVHRVANRVCTEKGYI
jgi:ligand-binding sensor domain-containing protein